MAAGNFRKHVINHLPTSALTNPSKIRSNRTPQPLLLSSSSAKNYVTFGWRSTICGGGGGVDRPYGFIFKMGHRMMQCSNCASQKHALYHQWNSSALSNSISESLPQKTRPFHQKERLVGHKPSKEARNGQPRSSMPDPRTSWHGRHVWLIC